MRSTSGIGDLQSEHLLDARPAQLDLSRGVTGTGYSSIAPPRAVPAPISSRSVIARSMPLTAALTSAPRSKRADASVLSPSFLLVRRTLFGSKNALSSTMVFVVSLTSDRPPPITPATACALSRVGDDQHLRIERAIDAVERRDALARCRAANPDFAARELLEVERVHRLAELEQHVVGDVDDVVDGTHTGGLQS